MTSVKVVFEWRVLPGKAEPFTKWLERLAAGAAAAPGYEGSSVFSAREDWLLLLRFADQAAFDRWQSEPRTAAHLAAGGALARGGPQPQQRTGLETWFTLPGSAAHAAPPRWKMALVTWCALLPQVVALGYVIPADLPPLAKAALGTAVPVVLLTWIVMPLLSRLLAPWFAPRAA